MILDRDNRVTINKIVLIIAVILVFVLVFPILHATCYSVFVGDDFSYANVSNAGENIISTILSTIKSDYFGGQGTYIASGLWILLSPLCGAGLTQLHVTLVIVNILLFISISLFTYVGVKKITDSVMISAVSMIILMYMLTAYDAYEEIYYWFSANINYAMPTVCYLIGIILLLKMPEQSKTVHNVMIVITIVFGFIAGGCTTTVVGMGCYFIFLYNVYNLVICRKINKDGIIVMSVWAIFGMINVFAPGNYQRHTYVDDTGVHPLYALKRTIKYVLDRELWMKSNTSIVTMAIIILVLAIIISFKVGKNFNWKCSLFIFLNYCAPVVVAFPVMLGTSTIYNENYVQFNNRCVFILDLAIYLAMIFSMIILGFLVGKIIGEKIRFFVIVIIVICAVVVADNDNWSIKQSVSYRTNQLLADNIIQNYYEKCLKLYDYMDSMDGQDVEVYENEYPQEIELFYAFYIEDYPDYWVNQAVSVYYNLNSVILIRE